ncbi:hypothetical protein [Silanimonas sp.]|uniref:hypothetical protein n=1 Tax=Silanimonas sp. TaxID=1929290 RepID=UPI0037C84B79
MLAWLFGQRKDFRPTLSVVPADMAMRDIGGGHGPSFPFEASLVWAEDLPTPDWQAFDVWRAGIEDDTASASAWMDAERSFVLHLAKALGPPYRVHESADAFVLSHLDDRRARVVIDHIGRTRSRVIRLLDGLAERPDLGKDVFLLFAEQDDYYRYISRYYPEGGEYAGSAGIHINQGCGHFAAHGDDLLHIEPTVVHEMTHSLVSHLPLPLWLNEGIAVNTERRLCAASLDYEAAERQARHRSFWNPQRIADFWSGEAFHSPGEQVAELAYDLARQIVQGLATNWPVFRDFALRADFADAGESAANETLGVGLGELVASVLDLDPQQTPGPSLSPQPAPP